MKKIVLMISLGLLLSSISCVSVQTGSYVAKEDSEIEATIREEVHDINRNIVEAIQTSNFDKFFAYYVTGLAAENTLKQQVGDLLPDMSKVAAGKEFVEYRDYYSQWEGKAKTPLVIFPKNDSDFGLSLQRVNDEMFISLLETKGEFNAYLLALVYTRQESEWKLYNSNLASFKVAEKNAVQWYQEALAFQEKGYLIPAIFRLQFADNTLKPAPFLKYDQEEQVLELTQKLLAELKSKYSFPIALPSVSSNPSIYFIEPQFVQSQILPVIKYMTSLSLDNEAALKAEAGTMSPLVREMFPGIAEGASHIVFRAFSEPPTDPNKTYTSYGTVVEVNP